MKSRLAFSLTPAFSSRLKVHYKKDNVIHSAVIPLDEDFSGFYLDNFIDPRIRVSYHKNKETIIIRRMDSESPSAKHKNSIEVTRNDNPSIGFESLFSSGNELRVLLKADNSIDNSVLFQHITYEWANERLWNKKFTYIFKVDLSVMHRDDFFTLGSRFLTPEEFIARIIHESLERLDSISVDEILAHLKNKSKMIKTLILCDGVGRIGHLINFSTSSPRNLDSPAPSIMLSILKTILKYPKVILNSNNHIAEIFGVNFSFDLILENTGFLKSDFIKYIKVHFGGTKEEQLLLDFVEHNYYIQEIRSPCILKMICYVLTRSEGLSLKSVSRSATLSSLYYDMMSLMSRNFESDYGHHNKELVIHFMQELAFQSMINKEFSIEQLAKRHSVEGEDIVDLVINFKLVRYEYTSYETNYRYFFKDIAFRDFLAASFLHKLLLSKEKDNIEMVSSFLANNQDKLEFLRVIKFLFGLITLTENEQEKNEIMSVFWRAIHSHPLNEIRIDGDKKIEFIMEILSQSILAGKIDPLVPKEILDRVDNAVISDIDKWKNIIIKSQYSSDRIFSFLLDSVDSPDLKIASVATSVLPFLNIRNQESKEVIANKLIEKIRSSSFFEIIEVSIRALQYLGDLPFVEKFLQEMLDDNRINVVLVTIEVIGNIADIVYAPILFAKLKDSNPWIVCSSLEALKKITHNKAEKEILKNFVVNILTFSQSYNQLIVNKAMDLLTRMHIDSKTIIDNILEMIKSSDDKKSIDALASLKSMFSYEINFDYDQVFIALSLKIAPYSRLFHRYTAEEYKITANIIEIFGDIFLKLSEANKVKAHSFLKDKLSINNEEAKVTAIYALDKISSYDRKIIALIEDKMTNSQYVSCKVAAINIIKEKFANFSERHKIEIISKIIIEVKKSKDNNFIIAALKFISKTYNHVNSSPRNTFISNIFNGSLYTDTSIIIEVLKLIADNIQQFNLDLNSKSFVYIQAILFNDVEDEVRVYGIKALGKLYKHSSNKDDAMSLLLSDKNFKSTNLEVRLEISHAFEQMILSIPKVVQLNLVSILLDKLEDPVYANKIFIVKSLMHFQSVAEDVSREIGGGIIKQILEGSDKLKVASMECLVELFKDNKIIIEGVLNNFITLLNKRTGTDFNHRAENAAIYAIGEIISVCDVDKDLINESIEILMKEIDSSSDLARISLTALSKVIFVVSQHKLVEIVTRLISVALKDDLDVIQKEVIANILCDIMGVDKFPKELMSDSIKIIFSVINRKVEVYDREVAGGRDFIDELVIKYLDYNIPISLEDSKKIELYLEVIFLRALTTSNSIMSQSLFDLLYRVNVNTNKLFLILEYKLSNLLQEEQLRIISLFSCKYVMKYSDFLTKEEFEDKIKDLEKRIKKSIKDVFDDIKSILTDPIALVTYARDNALDIRISIDLLSINGVEYPLLVEGSLDFPYKNAEIVLRAFGVSRNSNNILIEEKRDHFFSDITSSSLINDKVQFSILHQTTVTAAEVSLINIILMFEQITVFGYNLITVIRISNDRLTVSYHKTIDLNYKEEIFGGPSEYFSYFIKSISINRDEFSRLLETEFATCITCSCLIDRVRKVLDENSELSGYYSRIWQKGISVSHNYLIGFVGYREELADIRKRQDSTESRLEEIESEVLKLTADITDLKLSQDSLKELTLLLHKHNYPIKPNDLTPYEAEVARTIMLELDALYTFAKVVYKDRVANAQTGPAGIIAKLISKFSVYTSIARPIVDLFASLLSSYDARLQSKIVANIIMLAPTNSKAEVIIDKVANAIAKGEIHLERLPQESIFKKIFSFITSLPEYEGIIIDNIVEFFAAKMEKTADIDGDVAKGKEDGGKIANILIAIISAGECNERDYYSNEKILLSFFKDNGYIDFPVAALPLPDLPSIESKNEGFYIEFNVEDINYNQEIILAGGSLMKLAEIWPATKYLLTNWIPVIPAIEKLGLTSEFLSNHEHNIATGVYSIGAIIVTQYTQGNPYIAMSSGLLFHIKPYIYQLQNNLLEYIYASEDTDGYMKFGLYVGTEALLSTVSLPFIIDPSGFTQRVMSSPVTFLNDPYTKISLAQGAFSGSVKYLSHLSSAEVDNTISIISFPIPPIIAYFSYKQFQDISEKVSDPYVYAILLTANAVSISAFSHHGVVVIGNLAQEKVIEYIGENTTELFPEL